MRPRHYGDAVARHDAFFYYRLRRGLARQRLGQWELARADLESSVDLLPTADAYLGLGTIAERQGDRAAAIEHYGRAAQSTSAAGQTAADAAARLELPENPGKYLTTRTGLDANGQLTIELANPTRLTVDDVVLVVRYVGANGSRQQAAQRAGPLPPNGALRMRTGLGPFESSQQFDVAIGSARVVTQ